MTIADWHAEALNTVPDSRNEIHGDSVARRFGFRGGLVPGVTVSACLAHPAVVAWGRDFVERGRAHVRVASPLYDGEAFTVAATPTDGGCRTELVRPDGTVSASAELSLPDDPGTPPVRRGDPVAEADWVGPAASAERWAELARDGCRALPDRWHAGHRMATYARGAELPEPFAGDAPLANLSFVLGTANWILAANAHMNPWVHLETTSQCFRAIPAGTATVAEMTVRETFERKGHQFVDVTVALFDAADDAALAVVDQRAIWRLRGL
jgi:hypothetical protein